MQHVGNRKEATTPHMLSVCDRQQGIVGHVNNERGDVCQVLYIYSECSRVCVCAAQRVLIVLIRDARCTRLPV